VRRALAATIVAFIALSGCGGGDKNPKLKVSAASSLKNALPAYRPDAAYSFAGSDELAAQIRAGAKPDVYAAANTKLPQALYQAGLAEKPVPFAGNRLVMAVPADGKINALGDLEKPGVKIAMGAPSVPVGAYTRQVLAHLDAPARNRVLANVRSNEPDVAGVVGKLTQGAVDAGFVYVTDVVATKGKLKAVELPPPFEPSVVYAAAVVKGTKHEKEARAYIDGLLNGKGAAALKKAGFTPPAG
jgi:molybdate transport system substrate-binding protein